MKDNFRRETSRSDQTSWRPAFALFLGVALLGCFSPSAMAQVRVTVNGGQPIPEQNDGSSWEKALSLRQLAVRLTQAVGAGDPTGGDEYWVAEGTYPELWLHKNTKIYGGFDGTELFLGQRNPAKNVTTISSLHIEGYTVTIAVDGSPDTILPVWPDGGTLIDGCTITSSGETVRLTAAPSNGLFASISGSPVISGCQISGGSVVVYANGGSFQLVDCDISGSSGPGVVVFKSPDPPDTALELVRCQIHDNASAGIDVEGGPTLKMTDCTVTNNCLDSAGPTNHYPWSWGGICLQDPSTVPGTPYIAAEIRRCTISNNYAVGVYIDRNAAGGPDRKVLFDDCTITQNVEKFTAGGGVRCFVGDRPDSDDVTFFNCRISGNSAHTASPFTGGGGLYVNGPAIQVVACVIADNDAFGGGGAVHLTDLGSSPAIPTFRDCLIVNNTSGGKGGAFDLEYSDTHLINCTIANNHATGQGGAIYNYENRDGSENSLPVAPGSQRTGIIANCSFNGNSGTDGTVLLHDFGNFSSGDATKAPRPPVILNSTYLNGETWVRYWELPDTGSTTYAPLVLDPSDFAVADSGYVDATNGNYHLIATSLLIDRGDSGQVALGELDLDGQPRIFGPAVDVGAYEFATATQTPPQFILQPTPVAVLAGFPAIFKATASGRPASGYQWQTSANGGGSWTNVTDGAPYGGTATGTLTIISATTAMSGSQYRCVATNGVSPDATSDAATLTVTAFSDQAYLQQLFTEVLGRPIDSGAVASFGAALAGGESRTAVLGDLLGSAEYKAWQIEPAIRLYDAALARMPDDAGLRNWSNALHAGALTLTGAADQFAASPEFVLKYGSLDDTGYVQQLYRNVLGREADPAGLADWVGRLNGGATRGTILVGFSESPEFQTNMANQVEIVRLYDLLRQRMPTDTELQSWLGFLQGYDQTDTLFAQGYPSGMADSDYVSLVFQGFLRRPADAGALSTFGSALTAGTVTHGSLVDTLLSSTEFNQFVAPVSRLYMAAFHRVPDALGLDNWVAFVRAGNPLQSAADAFVASPEFQLTYGSLNDAQYVTLLYENVLGREPDPTGLATWTGNLGSGWTRGQVLIGFSESQEGIGLFVPTVRTFLHYFTFLNATPVQSDLDFWKNHLTTLDEQMREDLLADPAFANGG